MRKKSSYRFFWVSGSVYPIKDSVLEDIQQSAVLAVSDEKKLIDTLLKDNTEFQFKNVNRYKKSIREANNKVKAIDSITQSLSEDKLKGDITTEQFQRMSQNYQDEQDTLLVQIDDLEIELAECNRVQDNLETWIERIKTCITIDNLTRQVVVGLIDRIDVEETCTEDGQPEIDLTIHYKFGAGKSVSLK